MSDAIESAVEAICAQGCRVVTQKIATLKAGDDVPETAGLSGFERRLVLRELHEIMDVYDEPCGVGEARAGGVGGGVPAGGSDLVYNSDTNGRYR